MHIKRVVLHGFKTYKEQSVVENLSENINAIVGHNGSGKTNVYIGLRFLLCEIFGWTRTEDRARLLHEGTGLSVQSAYVEVVFDNRDARFPIEGDEVVMRRTIGLKKDDYYVNHKHVAKTDVANLLESAGFSRSNTYFIVQQFKVSALADMTEEERLDLLKEVAGTNVYDERRLESVKIMTETDEKREKIREHLSDIDNRLKDLEEEKAELNKFVEFDKERRALSFTLLEREHRTAIDNIEKFDAEKIDETDKLPERKNALNSEIKEIAREIDNLAAEIEDLNRVKNSLTEERQELMKQRARLELFVEEARRSTESNAKTAKELKKESEHVEAEIAKTQRELDASAPEFETLRTREAAAIAESARAQSEMDDIYSRSGRKSQFGSAKERDAWLNKEISTAEGELKDIGKQQQVLTKEISGLETRIVAEEKAVAESTKAIADHKKTVNDAVKRRDELKEKRDASSTASREIWRKQHLSEAEIKRLIGEKEHVANKLNSTIPRMISEGIACVERLVKEHNVRGYHGPLINLFKCEPKFFTAVDVSGGSALFQLVVDNDDVAARLIDLMKRENNRGRVTFMPLNRLHLEEVAYPKNTMDAIPLLAQLTFEPIYKAAFAQLFSRVMICRNLQVASSVVKPLGLNGVTLEGDQVNRKGALTGGFVDDQQSKLPLAIRVREFDEQINAKNADLDKIKAECAEKDQAVTALSNELEKLQIQIENATTQVRNAESALKEAQQALTASNNALTQKRAALTTITGRIDSLKQTITSHRAELNTEIAAGLTPQDKERIKQLGEAKTKADKSVEEVSKARSALESKRNALQSNMEMNLLKRKEEIASKLTAASEVNAVSGSYESRNKDFESVNSQVEERSRAIAETVAQIDEKQKATATLRARSDGLNGELNNVLVQITMESDSKERRSNQRMQYARQRDECARKIRELGMIPKDVATKFTSMSVKQLEERLRKAHDNLKKFSHVNKKAMDQYESFTNQRSELSERQVELDTSAESIRKMISDLDLKKDEVITNTFRSVAKNFAMVFKKLVPQGSAHLVMLKDKGSAGAGDEEVYMESDDDDENEDVENNRAKRQKKGADGKGKKGKTSTGGANADGVVVNRYKGVTIRASFTGANTSDSRLAFAPLSSLSGGQKTIVALALIFAIQLCDPAPFYLFDEIDAALDEERRVNLAKMIAEYSTRGAAYNNPRAGAADGEDGAASGSGSGAAGNTSVQFIISTFWPELITVADRCYGVVARNKASTIFDITKSEALTIVREEQSKNAAAAAAAAASGGAGAQQQQQQQQDAPNAAGAGRRGGREPMAIS